jgi:membrane protease YdiL (CAAX protease family)
MAVLSIYGSVVAVVGSAIAFAAAHGLVEGFPALLVFGIAIAFLRLRTGSVYPGMIFHATFNAFALATAFLR